MKLKFAYPIGKQIAQRWANGTCRMVNEDGTVQRRVMWFGITTFAGYAWSTKRKRWETDEEHEKNGLGGCSSHYRSSNGKLVNLRKFRRLLRTWGKYLPSGVEFILVSRYSELDATGKTP